MRAWAILILEWTLTIIALILIMWILICLHATFNEAIAKPIDDIYMRWHGCWNWCD